ncbi:hypothetical protein HPB49_009502 [Dermacentor silvarum]|uniref:Uncharacterized protein n=1 Tax=Dermacentor silvarum TaxID=543639 RepID=A0ACB8CK78_DERSI|nr:hypothetical protein HPB49_009502 [Dermacentor silvarum]
MSCYSTVCSRHFGSSDFKEGRKIRKLKKDAVPSIFEEYPAYLQPPKNRERSDACVRKREAAAPVNTPPPKLRAVESQLESPSLPLNDLPSVDVASQELSLMDCSATELTLPLENGASERCITPTVQVDRAVQVSSLFSVSAMDKRKWRRKERDLNARIERLKNAVDKYKQELQKLKIGGDREEKLQVQLEETPCPKETTNEPVLANSLLCFVLNGLSVSFKIPVAYFFARNCTGRELHMLMRHVLKEVEEIGFFVVRIVTDNHKINVLAMQLLCNGSLKHCIDHPGKPNRKLFLAFDQCYLIKNVRSQFLSRDIGKGGEISANHLKSLYRMQQGSLVKPVRFLTRKHVFPTNMEKMNVQRAVQVFFSSRDSCYEALARAGGPHVRRKLRGCRTDGAIYGHRAPLVRAHGPSERFGVDPMNTNAGGRMDGRSSADPKQADGSGPEAVIYTDALHASFFLSTSASGCAHKVPASSSSSRQVPEKEKWRQSVGEEMKIFTFSPMNEHRHRAAARGVFFSVEPDACEGALGNEAHARHVAYILRCLGVLPLVDQRRGWARDAWRFRPGLAFCLSRERLIEEKELREDEPAHVEAHAATLGRLKKAATTMSRSPGGDCLCIGRVGGEKAQGCDGQRRKKKKSVDCCSVVDSKQFFLAFATLRFALSQCNAHQSVTSALKVGVDMSCESLLC